MRHHALLQPHRLHADGEGGAIPHAWLASEIVAVDGLQRLHLLHLLQQRVAAVRHGLVLACLLLVRDWLSGVRCVVGWCSVPESMSVTV